MFTISKHFPILSRLISIILCSSAFYTSLYSQSTQQPSDIVKQLFIGMHAKDTTGLSTLFYTNASLQSYIVMQNKPVRLEKSSIKEFIVSIAKIPEKVQVEEELISITQLAESNLAMIWAPYRLVVDNRSRWCGTNLFTLVYEEERWQIISITDTRRDCTE